MMTDAAATLDTMFQNTVARRPDALALLDPPDKAEVTGENPRRLTYAQADRAITALASRLRHIGLSSGSIVAIQLPNTVESILTFLAVIRAGMIAAPMPLLWRRADGLAALARISPKAIVTTARVGPCDHATLATEIAAELFSVRHVCAFGATLPDGVTPLVGYAHDGDVAPLSLHIAGAEGTAKLAAITFETTVDGVMPVARTHRELLAGGFSVARETGIAPDSVMLASLPASSFGGIATTLVPWLISGGTLVLHHPANPEFLVRQIREQHVQTAILPQAVVSPLLGSGAFSAVNGLTSIVSVCRTPERRNAEKLVWKDLAFTDVLVFGETALIPARRDAAGMSAPIRMGPLASAREDNSAMAGLLDVAPNAAGRLACRGAMVPHHSFSGSTVSAKPQASVSDDHFVDTGYACRLDTATGYFTITAPPPGMVSVGGYRFSIRDVQNLISGVDKAATVAALPDTLTGHRLAGHAPDRTIVRHALNALGINPLVAGALRDRRRA